MMSLWLIILSLTVVMAEVEHDAVDSPTPLLGEGDAAGAGARVENNAVQVTLQQCTAPHV